MITGFNTDIIHDGVTYHVQTEDKGLATPLILSLVYDHGTILASKRSPYQDLIDSGNFDDDVLTERLQRQHKLICAAVKGGRIEDLKRMTAKESGKAKKLPQPDTVLPKQASQVVPEVRDSQTEIAYEVVSELAEIVAEDQPETIEVIDENVSAQIEVIAEQDLFPAEVRINTTIEPPEMVIPITVLNQIGYDTIKMPKFSAEDLMREIDEINVDDVIIEIIEDESPQIHDVVTEIIEDKSAEVSFDGKPALTAIKEAYLTVTNDDISVEIDREVNPFELESTRIPKPAFGLTYEVATVVAEEAILPEAAVAIVSENINNPDQSPKLSLKIADDSEFVGGTQRTLRISAHRRYNQVGLVKAHVIIKILGSSFRPMIFHAKTGSDGFAVVHLQLPSFKSGRAVLLVRALFEGEETEIRYPVTQGGTPTAW